MMMIIIMTMMIIGTTTIMIMIVIITTTLTMTIMKMIMIKTAQTPCQSLYAVTFNVQRPMSGGVYRLPDERVVQYGLRDDCVTDGAVSQGQPDSTLRDCCCCHTKLAHLVLKTVSAWCWCMNCVTTAWLMLLSHLQRPMSGGSGPASVDTGLRDNCIVWTALLVVLLPNWGYLIRVRDNCVVDAAATPGLHIHSYILYIYSKVPGFCRQYVTTALMVLLVA